MWFFLTGQKLDIIHQQKIDRKHILLESFNSVIPDGIDHSFDKLQWFRIIHFFGWICLENIIGNRHHQMCFSKPGIAVDKQRIKEFSRIECTRKCSCLWFPVAVPYNKVFKGPVFLNIHGMEFIFIISDFLTGISLLKIRLLRNFNLNRMR